MLQLDEGMLDFQIQLDDWTAKFDTWTNAIAAYNAYHGLASKGSAKPAKVTTSQSPVQDMKAAIKELESMFMLSDTGSSGLPHVFLFTQHLLRTDEMRVSGPMMQWVTELSVPLPGSPTISQTGDQHGN